eukprot:TRINITY_DN22812_c0_g1_i1.p1 TRINITY_DN22812_c0_g1~~TRINITY_DN22812_c0_g1_i1.p1  ORF type:complete len:291 (+),score=88.43 TRINITY_DN22812_c0_g1_i1:142-1014(+)
MSGIDHLGIKVSNLQRSKEFYSKTLGSLGFKILRDFGVAVGFGVAKPIFWMSESADVSPQRFAFDAPDRASVDAFWSAGLAAGGKDSDAPVSPFVYVKALLDPDGHRIEAIDQKWEPAPKRKRDDSDDAPKRTRSDSAGTSSQGGNSAEEPPLKPVSRGFNNVALKVSDMPKSREWYTGALEPLGIKMLFSDYESTGYGTTGDPFLWLNLATADEAVKPVHVAFAAPNAAVVEAFHGAALAVGGTDNGKPGPRPMYGPSYFGGFVLDPDGHNVEAQAHVINVPVPDSGSS